MKKNVKYIEQYERVKRWYFRFKDINDGMIHNKNSDYYEDEIHAFFINCYHLKDWLRKSNKEKYFDVGTLFNEKSGKLHMKICADFCNGSKHVEAGRTAKIDKNTKIAKKSVKICLQEPLSLKKSYKPNLPPIVVLNYSIEVNGNYYDAFDIATKCITEWEKYLNERK